MATQQEIAADLGLSQPAVSGALNAIGLMKREWEALPLEDARRLLVRHYTEVAAGRGGDDQYNLTRERARESRLKGDLLQLQIHEKSGALIPADAVEQGWQSLIVAARSELLLVAGKVVHAIKALHGIDVDPGIIDGPILDALHRLADADSDAEEPA